VPEEHHEEDMAKQKLKTRKSVAKRIKVTGTGLILHAKGARNHKRMANAPRTRRLISKMIPYTPGFAKTVRRQAPFKKR
jgi:large subunit ribosomal protein L35